MKDFVHINIIFKFIDDFFDKHLLLLLFNYFPHNNLFVRQLNSQHN